jgi:Domain of unknown function (DUF4282)
MGSEVVKMPPTHHVPAFFANHCPLAAKQHPRLTGVDAGCTVRSEGSFSGSVKSGAARASPISMGEATMFGISDLFQWERFVTPTVIKVFYWLAVVISVILGLAGAVSALTSMAFNPFIGMMFLIASLLGACMGVVIARIIAEFVLIVFRINEHLAAIRNQGSGMRHQ